MSDTNYRPAGRLVPVFSAHDNLSSAALSLALCKSAAARGETTLLLDVIGGALMTEAGVVMGKTLGDVLYRKADIRDAKYISHNEHFTAAAAGDASLDALLGSLAALSLNYDWLIVCPEPGCTPAHVRLAAAADASLLGFSGAGDQFMRAYWMLDAVRARAPKFDPLVYGEGNEQMCFEAYDMLKSTVREFLGAPPALAGIIENQSDISALAPVILESLRQDTITPADRKSAAIS